MPSEGKFVISNFTDQELVEIWEAALRAAGRDPEASKVVPRLGLVGAAKQYYQNRICVHNTARETVLVSVVCVDVITWALNKIFQAGASAEVAVKVKEAANTTTSLATFYAMRDGESRHIVLSSEPKAFVTVASVTDPTRLFCENEVVVCGQKMKIQGPPARGSRDNLFVNASAAGRC